MNPPLGTVVFDCVPSGWLVGIDLQFFNTTSVLKGIKLIPDGVHVIHFAQDQSSIRSGFYVNVKEGDVIIISWDDKQEKLRINEEIGELNVSKELSKLPDYYLYMIKYPDDKDWFELVKFIDFNQVEYILQKRCYVDSVLTSTDENNLLLDVLTKSSKNRNLVKDPIINSIIDQSSEEMRYSIIDLNNTIRPNSSIQEKTVDSLDKSWFLNQLLIVNYNSNYKLLLSELQLGYLNMIIFANYSSSIQWLKIIRTLLNCKEIIVEKFELFNSFLNLLYFQFMKFPDEYMDQFIDEEFLIRSISEFEYTIKELNLHKLVKVLINLKHLLNSKFGILIQGLVEDDDELPTIVEL